MTNHSCRWCRQCANSSPLPLIFSLFSLLHNVALLSMAHSLTSSILLFTISIHFKCDLHFPFLLILSFNIFTVFAVILLINTGSICTLSCVREPKAQTSKQIRHLTNQSSLSASHSRLCFSFLKQSFSAQPPTRPGREEVEEGGG